MKRIEVPITKDDIRYMFKKLLEMGKISAEEYRKLLVVIARSRLVGTYS